MTNELKNTEGKKEQKQDKVLKDYLRTIEEIDVFNRIGKTLTSTLDTKIVLQKMMTHISNLFKPDRWSLLLVDENNNELFFEIYVGKDSTKIKPSRLRVGEGVAGWVAMNGKPLVIPDVSQTSEFSSYLDELYQLTNHSVICVPLKVRNKVLGVIELVHKPDSEDFSDHDLLILTTLADYAAIALENARIYTRIQEISVIDDVTGLYNSRYMHSILEMELDRAKRYNSHISIIFMDLDYFKNINDTYGHLVGSQLLWEIAEVMKECIRKVDYLCRYGGDEFVLILPNTTKSGAMKVAGRLQQSINNYTFLQEQGLDVKMTSSFGVASFPEDATTPDELIRRGDEAMYQVKNTTRNGISTA